MVISIRDRPYLEIMVDLERVEHIIQILKRFRFDAKSELIHKNPLDFLVAVILSAQATDKGVNKITPKLFSRYKNASDYANSSIEEISSYIKSINYYKTKAKRIRDAGEFLVKKFDGKVPKHISDLIRIPGIARKSANVISQEAFNVVEGIVVDTHVTRVSQRLKFTKNSNAIKIEKDLMNIIPREYWKDCGMQIVLHGRYICVAKSPKCPVCPIKHLCPSAKL